MGWLMVIKTFCKQNVLPILGVVGAVVAGLFIHKDGKKKGEAKGEKKVAKEHEKIVEKVVEREEAKNEVSEQTVGSDLNNIFNDRKL